MLSRRGFCAATLLVAPAFNSAKARAQADGLQARIEELERRHGGRLGVAVFDLSSGVLTSHRGDERFAMCSTFKLLAAACVLSRVDRGEEDLARRVRVARADLAPYSPVTSRYADTADLTMEGVCAAAIRVSDNTAGNLMLAAIGGPAGLTAFVRTLGDDMTRLDRNEPDLNEARPGDPRDTTTPVHMLRLVQRLVLGDALRPESRARLVAWMEACETGSKMLRAGLTAGWRAGDKTGSGDHNVRNDVAVFWPPDREPVLVAAFYADSRANDDERNAVFAALGDLARRS